MKRTVFATNRNTLGPLTGAALVLAASSYANDLLSPLEWAELGGGLYEIEIPDERATAGVVVLIDFGLNALERYAVEVVYPADNRLQAWGVVLTDTNGVLWTGVGPTVGAYRWSDGTDRIGSAPVPAQLSVIGSVWLTRPSVEDIQRGTSIRLDAPAGTASIFFFDRTDAAPLLTSSLLGVDIQAILASDPSVSALVADPQFAHRIFPNVLPQTAGTPSIVYFEVSDLPELTFTTRLADTAKNTKLQIDCYGKRYKDAKQLADTVRNALDVDDQAQGGLSILFETSRDLYDDATSCHRVSMDFNVWR